MHRHIQQNHSQPLLRLAKTLYEQFFVHYGFPAKLHSDQGRNFESLVIKFFVILLVFKNLEQHHHPMGNGLVERFNRTLENILGTLEPEKKPHWRKYISSLVHAYNCSKHDTTGFLSL